MAYHQWLRTANCFFALTALLCFQSQLFSQSYFSPVFAEINGADGWIKEFILPIDGDLILGMEMNGQFDFAGEAHNPTGAEGTLITRIKSDGDSVWSIVLNGAFSPSDMHFDPVARKILIALQYNDPFTLDGFSLPAPMAGNDNAIIQMDENGSVDWITPFRSLANGNTVHCIYRDESGDVYVGGEHDGDFVIATDTITVLPTLDRAILVKLDGSTGGLDWWQQSSGVAHIKDVTVSSTGDVFAIARFQNSDNFGGMPILGGGAQGILKLDDLGVTQNWRRTSEPYVDHGPLQIENAPGGGIYVTTKGSAFSFDSIAYPTLEEVYLVLRYDENLVRDWHHEVFTGFFTYPFGKMAVSPWGDVAITATAMGDIHGDGFNILTPWLMERGLLYKLDPSGNLDFILLNGSQDARMQAIAFSGDDIWQSGQGMFTGLGYLLPTPTGTSGLWTYFLGRLNGRKASGTAYIDVDGDMSFGTTDIGIPSLTVFDTVANLALTQTDGAYTTFVDSFAREIYCSVPPYYNLTYPASGYHQIDSNSADTAGLDFIFDPIPGIQDLELFSAPLWTSLGLPTTFSFTVKNVGTTEPDGLLKVVPDSRFTYLGGDPVPDSVVGDTVFWNFDSLTVFASRTFELDLFVDTLTFEWADTTCTYALVEPLAIDTTPFNNVDTVKTAVVAAYDPNIKTVEALWTAQPDPWTITPSTETLLYTIHFQNEGDASARRVRIVDALPPELDKNSIVLLSSSHDVSVYFNEVSELIFLFDSIDLPPEAVDEAGSMGYASFAIDLVPGLSIGDSIINTAAIYFDFNDAVITPAAYVVIRENVSVSAPAEPAPQERFDVEFYPNPSAGIVTLVPPSDASIYPLRVRLLDASGKLQQRVELASPGSRSLDLSTSAGSGVYTLVVTNNAGIRKVLRVVVFEE